MFTEDKNIIPYLMHKTITIYTCICIIQCIEEIECAKVPDIVFLNNDTLYSPICKIVYIE